MKDEQQSAETDLDFGQSQFAGPQTLGKELNRWMVQFLALFKKNMIILKRRSVSLFSFLFLPSMIILVFLMERDSDSSSSADLNLQTIPINGLGKCNSYYPSCTQIVYAPNTAYPYYTTMDTLSTNNDLVMGDDVKGFSTIDDARSYVASNLGRVQYTVLFDNKTIWTPSDASSYSVSTDTFSYVLFYNNTIKDRDNRTAKYDLNYPLLVLQMEIEKAYLQTAYPSNFTDYKVQYGQFWDQAQGAENLTVASNTTTRCDLPKHGNMAAMSQTMMWIFVFVFLFVATIPFNLIGDERRKKLFGFLRRLGLMDSAYWASWFLIFEILLVIACGIAMIVAVIIRPHSKSLDAIDLDLLFLIFWLTGTSFISFAFAMAALSSSASMNTAIYSAEFLVALVTVAFCAPTLCDYAYFIPVSGVNAGVPQCHLVASAFNTVYSRGLLGYGFVQFLVFFLPWYYGAQAMSNALSIAQYDGLSIGMSDVADKVSMSYDSSTINLFTSPWLDYSFLLLFSQALFYMGITWLAAQLLSADGTEGRSLINVLIPAALRRHLFREREDVQDGDVRGKERLLSEQENSVRAYKVSKTFSGVQALKEVSFGMNTGEVFVLLGHNGAGKSTLINIITGLVSPTHGKVYMMGQDVDGDSAEVQQMIGVCPQDDVLWDDLNSLEHMHLVAAFKGLKWGAQLDVAVEKVLRQVQLYDRRTDFASQYSGGMKRRLSVALSTVGDVKVIFFDEPTTGLDPLSRRRVWETINALKKNRVVVLTTHNMEEADFLGDTIMIMHGGRVRAVGDPLFLKQTYGSGYHVGMLVHREQIPQVSDVVTQMLPGSSCESEELTGSVTVGVVREDIGGLSRLFHWLERSKKAKTAVREWGISNTTLEQVFLMLCVQNTEVNFIDPSRSNQMAQHALCPICRRRNRSTIVVGVWPKSNLPQAAGRPLMMVPDSLCTECAQGNHHYFISESAAQHAIADASGQELDTMLQNARMDEQTAESEAMMASFEAAGDRDEPEDWVVAKPAAATVDAESQGLLTAAAADAAVPLESNSSSDGGALALAPKKEDQGEQATVVAPTMMAAPYAAELRGSITSQILALYVKNVTMQSKQQCSNACSVCFVGFMFLLIYIFSLLFRTITSLDQCGQGYISSDGCDLVDLKAFVFSGNDFFRGDSISKDLTERLEPRGYAIKNFLVPAMSYTPSVSDDDFSDAEGGSINLTVSYGFNDFSNRYPILWTSLLNSSQLTGESYLSIGMRSPPSSTGAGTTPSSANEVQYTAQLNTFSEVENNGVAGDTCPYYAESTLIETSDYEDVVQDFSEIYSDVSYSCPTCAPYNPDGSRSSSQVYFDGTMWVSKSSSSSSGCSNIGCFSYPYAFVNFITDNTDVNTSYLDGFSNACPDGVQSMSKNPQFPKDQTYLSMTYLNLLSNNMLGKMLYESDEFAPVIQGAYTPYGELFFDAQLISAFSAFWMVLFGMMLINGFWPIAVWRAGHERSGGLVEMMNTVGMRPSTYLLGMFTFDMIISLISGIALIGFAKEANMLSFKDAPLDWMIAIVCASAYVLNAGTMIFTLLAGRKASVLSLFAACLVFASAAASSLFNLLLYRSDGTWPLALSLIPFLAQGRALYIVLVYKVASDEVTGSLWLMFGEGTLFLILALLVAEKDEVLQSFVKCMQGTPISGGEGKAVAAAVGSDHQVLPQQEIELGAVVDAADVVDGDLEAGPRKGQDAEAAAAIEGGGEEEEGGEHKPLTSSQVQEQRTLLAEIDQDLVREKQRAIHYVQYQEEALAKLSPEERQRRRREPFAVNLTGEDDREEADAERNARIAIALQEMKYKYPPKSGVQALLHQLERLAHVDESDTSFWAVRGISLALQFGECFGLLGPNGAGKSTTISILIGKLRATLGRQFVAGEDVSLNIGKVHQFIGVCPQFDVVWNDLTVAEHISFQARQRGVPLNMLNAKVQQAALAVGLDGDGFFTKAGNLSGGMRRRLSIAMSLVGDPPIIFMDEPTTGLDPDNRQAIWRIIQRIKNPARLILLTTHSMEEAEALCTRIGIMAKGQLRCVGTAAHLKARYGKGYTLTVNQLPAPSAADAEHRERVLDEFIVHEIGHDQAHLLSSINRTRKYLVDKGATSSIAEIFKNMESQKNRLFIREWGLSMTTLEEVFISAVNDE